MFATNFGLTLVHGMARHTRRLLSIEKLHQQSGRCQMHGQQAHGSPHLSSSVLKRVILLCGAGGSLVAGCAGPVQAVGGLLPCGRRALSQGVALVARRVSQLQRNVQLGLFNNEKARMVDLLVRL